MRGRAAANSELRSGSSTAVVVADKVCLRPVLSPHRCGSDRTRWWLYRKPGLFCGIRGGDALLAFSALSRRRFAVLAIAVCGLARVCRLGQVHCHCITSLTGSRGGLRQPDGRRECMPGWRWSYSQATFSGPMPLPLLSSGVHLPASRPWVFRTRHAFPPPRRPKPFRGVCRWAW